VILLKTVNLRKQFGDTKACDGLDFIVHKGEFLSLVGSNGAGKTTLVNLISAHLQPDSGQILLEDRDITSAAMVALAKIGVHKADGTPLLTAFQPRLQSRDQEIRGRSVERRCSTWCWCDRKFRKTPARLRA